MDDARVPRYKRAVQRPDTMITIACAFLLLTQMVSAQDATAQEAAQDAADSPTASADAAVNAADAEPDSSLEADSPAEPEPAAVEPADIEAEASPAPESAEHVAPVHDLAALLEAATSHYPGLTSRARAIEAAQARVDEARLSPFFQWTATAGFTVAPSARGTPTYSPDSQLPLGNPWRPVASVSVSGVIPIYTFGKIRALRRATRAGVRAAEADAQLALAQLHYDVRRAYFALQLALDVKQMISEGRGKLVEGIAKLDELLDDDDPDANPIDRHRLVAALADVDARASQAERLERGSRAALRALTGLTPIRVPECPIARAPFELGPLADYLASARDNRPEASMLEAAREAREADLDATRARYFPDIGLAFRAGISWGPGVTDQENPFIQDPANTPVLGAGLVARWSLDIAGNVHRVRRSEALLNQLRAQTEEAQAALALEVELAYEQLRDADRREQAFLRGERATRSWFVAAAQGYQLGTVEPKDLVDALRGYFTNRYMHLQAVLDFNTAIANFERVAAHETLPPAEWEHCR